MKCIISFFLFITFSPLRAEPFYDLLKKYADDFFAVSEEIKTMADSIKTLYPETYFIMHTEDGIIFDVLNQNQVKDTLIGSSEVWVKKEVYNENEIIKKYPYDTLYLLLDDVKRMIRTSIPEVDFCVKTAIVKENFLNSETFNAKINNFKDNLNVIVQMASIIRNKDSLFLSQYDNLNDASDLFNWTEWHKTMLEIQHYEIEKSLKKFEVRYGKDSDKINLFELLLINIAPPFKGNIKSPSPWEPIARLSLICYNITDAKYVKTAQVGFNYYFLDKPFLGVVHHAGLAFAITDINSQHVYNLSWPSFGFIAHLGKYQVGIIRDKTTTNLKFISTIDFQIIPKLF